MGLRFVYRRFNVRKPIWPLFGRTDRPCPVVNVAVIGPAGTWSGDALLDTGADDTVFPDIVAQKTGTNLVHAPTGSARGLGSTAPSVLRYAEVLLRLTDGRDFREWPARVGFTNAPLSVATLGFAGCLEFFVSTFDGNLEQVELTVNPRYPGV